MTETSSLWPKSIRNANSIATGLEAPNISVDDKWRANVSPEAMNIKDEKTYILNILQKPSRIYSELIHIMHRCVVSHEYTWTPKTLIISESDNEL